MTKSIDLPPGLLSRLTSIATLAALRGGQIVRDGFSHVKNIEKKEGRHDLVTEYDKLSEEAIINFIRKTFPDHSFLGEEGGAVNDKGSSIKWIIDPLDGTVNFARSVPVFAISIAATYAGEVLAGVIYQPMTNELFIAEKGSGAFLNGVQLHVSKTKLLNSAFMATGLPHNCEENPRKCLDYFLSFSKLGVAIRRLGSAALDLAYVAAGRFDGFWEVTLKPWDYAAGKLLVEEAGGTFSDFSGKPYTELNEGTIAASNQELHAHLIKNLALDGEE